MSARKVSVLRPSESFIRLRKESVNVSVSDSDSEVRVSGFAVNCVCVCVCVFFGGGSLLTFDEVKLKIFNIYLSRGTEGHEILMAPIIPIFRRCKEKRKKKIKKERDTPRHFFLLQTWKKFFCF